MYQRPFRPSSLFASALVAVAAMVALLTPVGPAAAVTYAKGSHDGSQRPWAVNIWDGSGRLMCSGTLISARWVLTAAHCIVGVPQPLTVRRGATDAASGAATAVTATIAHPDYAPSSFGNDLGLLYLGTELKGPYVKLAPRDDASVMKRYADELVVYGWGRDETGAGSGTLRWTSQRDISAKGRSVIGRGFETRTMIAAGRWDAGRKRYSGACSGDSGGPLVTPGSRPVVVGVVSFGALRCSTALPSVYTRVGAFLPWITRTTATAPDTDQKVNINVVGSRLAMTATVSGAGSGRLDLQCDQPGSSSVMVVLGEGRSEIRGVPAGSWSCRARPTGSSTWVPIGRVAVL